MGHIWEVARNTKLETVEKVQKYKVDTFCTLFSLSERISTRPTKDKEKGEYRMTFSQCLIYHTVDFPFLWPYFIISKFTNFTNSNET